MRRVFFALLFLLTSYTLRAAETLEVYFVDVEGGQATLVVSPSGESMLVDAGWPGYGGRDAERIVAAAKAAGVKQIDYLLVTHYHLDHVGGVPPLAAKIPIVHFVDHGAVIDTDKDAQSLFAAYRPVREKGQHLVVKPGDKIPLKGLDVEVVAAAGKLITAPLEGAGAPNPLCATTPQRAPDPTENAQSVGIIIRFGKFRLANLADLTWNKELELVCPVNRVGTVDVYLSTHHGMNLSGSAAMVHALAPRVAIMNNGARKGGSPDVWQIVRSSPGLEDIWQLHYAVEAGRENNAPERFIANLEERCQGYGLKLSARADGSFTVTNLRNGYAKAYRPNPH
jgi:beta-lactamase superfamily II metal-dependent hydrolase